MFTPSDRRRVVKENRHLRHCGPRPPYRLYRFTWHIKVPPKFGAALDQQPPVASKVQTTLYIHIQQHSEAASAPVD